MATQTNGQAGSSVTGLGREAVVIVTGGSFGAGRELARALASRGWSVVVVYLEHQPAAEATVTEILAAQGTAVAIRADITDELDVERLFAETTAAFGGVDIVVHTTPEGASLLYRQAARYVRRRGAIVSVARPGGAMPGVSGELHERDISICSLAREQVFSFLERWRAGAAT
jgi:3-oxoacyl-[acyl-carrier protein] reductase